MSASVLCKTVHNIETASYGCSWYILMSWIWVSLLRPLWPALPRPCQLSGWIESTQLLNWMKCRPTDPSSLYFRAYCRGVHLEALGTVLPGLASPASDLVLLLCTVKYLREYLNSLDELVSQKMYCWLAIHEWACEWNLTTGPGWHH